MVIDTSALLAIFLAEPERKPFLESILQAETRMISAANVLETGIVLEARRGEAAGREFDLFVVRANLQVASVDSEQTEIARSAWRKYGKGRHPAALTSEIVLLMRWLRPWANHFWRKAVTLLLPILKFALRRQLDGAL